MNDKKEELSEKLQGILDDISELSILELADLVEAMEEKFGVSAVATAPAVAPAGEEEEKEEKSAYDVSLEEIGDNKIAVIKAVRELDQNLGLKEAKELVESAPAAVLEQAPVEEAEEAKEKLEEAGGKVELQ